MNTLAQLTPVYCIGESHCLRLRNLVHTTADGLLLHARARFLPNVSARNFANEQGLHADVADALAAEELCVPGVDEAGNPLLRPAHRPRTRDERIKTARHAALAGEPVAAPPLLLFAGDMDLHTFLQEFGADSEFLLPEDDCYGSSPGLTRIPYDAVELALARFLDPFAMALAMLIDAGFTRTFVHALPPRPADTALTTPWSNGVPVSASVRSKLTVATNRLLLQRCARLGIGFLDPWPTVARDGYLDPAFDLDHLHLNRRAAQWTLAELAHRLRDDTARAFDQGQYELSAELAEVRTHRDAERAPEPIAAHLARTHVPVQRWRQTLGNVQFSTARGNAAAHPGWVGLPSTANVPADLGELDVDRVQRLHELLHGDAIAPLLHWDTNLRRIASCARLLRTSQPAGVNATADLGAPPHARRALFVIAGRVDVIWQPAGAGSASDARATLGPGDGAAFDPARWRLRADAVAEDTVILELALIPEPPAVGSCTIAAGWCDWPIDPMAIPLSGRICAPPTEAATLRGWRESAATLG